ncbi:MAG: DNA repair protein RadA [Candidatus Nanopelagicales bacterium]
MAKTGVRPAYRCSECGWASAKWVGRCGECQAWATVSDTASPVLRSVPAGPVTAPALPIDQVTQDAAARRASGLTELDRVLGGGLVAGAVVLLAGEPGVGKSTLLLEVAARTASATSPTLYVSGEESASQVRLRAERVGAMSPHLYLAAETDISAVLTHVDAVQPGLIVVDSVQTMSVAGVDGTAGGVTQVREVAATLTRVAKERGIATVLVGHVTKDGAIAGPRLLEHLVDVVLNVDGERHTRLRVIRALKNRYGPADEIGCFDLSDAGVLELPDPSGLFLSRRDRAVAGTCVTVTLEGRRPLVAEVQALVAAANVPAPRRATSGLDSARTAMVLAVLDRRGRVPLANKDVYASSVGGVRLTEPASDLAVALAVASAECDVALPPGLCALGEVGLSGEVRPVAGVSRRLSEAARLGFRYALVPSHAGEDLDGIRVIEVPDLGSALSRVLNSA